MYLLYLRLIPGHTTGFILCLRGKTQNKYSVKAPGLTLPVVALWGPAAETTRASLVREPAAAIRMAGTQASQLLAGRR